MTRFAGSFKLLVFLILAACSQVQTPNTPTPQVPTVMSTDLSDGATDVAADAEGNAYVVGYRNASNIADGLTGDIFVSRFDVAGKMAWLTVLQEDEIISNEFSVARVAITQKGVYVVAQSVFESSPVSLYRLGMDGEVLWSKRVFEESSRQSIGSCGLATTSNNQIYIVSSASHQEGRISVFDETGSLIREIETLNCTYEVARDGSIYKLENRTLFKVGADGTPSWERPYELSVPEGDNPYLHNEETFVADGSVYAVVYFPRPDGKLNAEIRRFDTEGNALWAQLVIPEGEELPACYKGELSSATHCIDVLGVTADGDVYASRGETLIRITPSGERTEALIPFVWQGAGASDLDTVRQLVTLTTTLGSESGDVLYEVGIDGQNESEQCENANLENTSKNCAYTNAYVKQYSIGRGAEFQTSLMWRSY